MPKVEQNKLKPIYKGILSCGIEWKILNKFQKKEGQNKWGRIENEHSALWNILIELKILMKD